MFQTSNKVFFEAFFFQYMFLPIRCTHFSIYLELVDKLLAIQRGNVAASGLQLHRKRAASYIKSDRCSDLPTDDLEG